MAKHRPRISDAPPHTHNRFSCSGGVKSLGFPHGQRLSLPEGPFHRTTERSRHPIGSTGRPPPPLIAAHRLGQRHRPRLRHSRRPAGRSAPPRGIPVLPPPRLRPPTPGAIRNSAAAAAGPGQAWPPGSRPRRARSASSPAAHPSPAPAASPTSPGPGPAAEAEAAAEALRWPHGARRKRSGRERCGGEERAPCRAEREARRSR
ncbi:translation machinery-associated protein 7 isoform 1-T1 [Amazona ochrocephala]